MTNIETLKILSVLRAAYPNFYKDMTDEDIDGIVSLWSDMFVDDDSRVVGAAVKALISSSPNPFPPVIGQIKEKIQQLTQADGDMTEEEAWHTVFSVLKNCGYNYVEEFEKLPQDIQQIVGSPTRLHEWAMMDTQILQSVVASNFQRSYKARAATNREYKRLPADVRAFVSSIGAKFDMNKRLEDNEDTKADKSEKFCESSLDIDAWDRESLGQTVE